MFKNCEYDISALEQKCDRMIFLKNTNRLVILGVSVETIKGPKHAQNYLA